MKRVQTRARRAGRPMARRLALALLVALLGISASAQAQVNTTMALVSFREGELNMVTDPSGSGLNFNFGDHLLPVSEVIYPAVNGDPHILTVEDGRMKSGNWHVTVALTSFTMLDGGPEKLSFDARTDLKTPLVQNENAAVGTTGLTVNNNISVTSYKGEQLVMQADSTLNRGVYSLTWDDADVTLSISDSQVHALDLEAYTALVSWTLNMGPY